MIWGETPEILLTRLLVILYHLLERDRCAADHNVVVFRKKINWCGKFLSGQPVSHDPKRTHGLSEVRRPEITGELMQFLQDINWMRTSLPELAELEARGAARRVSVQHASHQASGGAPCYWQQRVDGRTHGRVGCCATAGERGGALKSLKARILCDDVLCCE